MKNIWLFKIKKVFISLYLLSILSCNELVTDDFPDFESLPTVNSILVEGEPLSVHLSLTGGLDSLPLPTIDNALIKLYTDGVFSEQLIYTEKGIYTSKAIIEYGKEYKCKIIIPDYDTIVCSHVLPVPSPILNIEHINIAGRDEEGEIYSSIKITFKNKPSLPSYYYVGVKSIMNFHSENNLGPKISFSFPLMESVTDPVFLNEGLPIPLFSNEIIEDTIYTITMNERLSTYPSETGKKTVYPYILELHSLTYDYYRYLKQYYLYTEGKYTDIGESISSFPLYSNIENGYGIFAGYSVFVSDTISPEPYVDK